MPDRFQSLRSRLSSIPPKGLLAIALVVVAALFTLAIWESAEPDPVGGPPMVRRLTEDQYRNSIADVFAPDIEISGRFEQAFRAHGLIAIGTGQAGISPFAVEQYDVSAQGIAQTVLSIERRDEFLDCGPQNPHEFDELCAHRFLSDTGLQLFRRPLSDADVDRFADMAAAGTEQLGDFYKGLELGLYAMLVSPEFLFRLERADADADPDEPVLDAYSRAERLSFFLTGSTPDRELLRAASDGDLNSASGVRQQAERLMQSDRFEGAVRTFFADMLEFDRFADLTKDPAIYPAFNSELVSDAQEQTLRTIANHLITNDGDYRDLFTTRDTYLTRTLGVVYRTPVPARDDWQAVTFAPDASRAGIQSHISFLSLHAHPGRSSPTLRGYAIRQAFLCQEVPDPPANVDFAAIEPGAGGVHVTARDRLSLHATEASCAGCHKVMDPPGLGLENYDGLGGFRSEENGVSIDLSGDLDGTAFSTADGLAQALRDHPETPRCLAQRMYTAAVGREIEWDERYYLDWLIDGFAADDYNVPSLMWRIATSENFFAVAQSDGGPEGEIARSEGQTGDSL